MAFLNVDLEQIEDAVLEVGHVFFSVFFVFVLVQGVAAGFEDFGELFVYLLHFVVVHVGV